MMLTDRLEFFDLQLADGRHCLRPVTTHRAQADLSFLSQTAVSEFHDVHESHSRCHCLTPPINFQCDMTARQCLVCIDILKELHAFIELHASELHASHPLLYVDSCHRHLCCVKRVSCCLCVWLKGTPWCVGDFPKGLLTYSFSFLSCVVPKHVFACKGHNVTEDGAQLRTFKLFRRLYKYSSELGTFQQLPAMPRHLPDQICRALESLRLVNTAGMSVHF